MNLFVRMTVAAGMAAIAAASTAPAGAVLATDYVAPKLAHLGKTSIPIAGTGIVVIKVLVKADGSFQVMNIIRSTNHGDDTAALDLARHSTYHRALRGGKPTTAFYDFTLNFNGKSYASGGDNTGAPLGAGGNAQTSAITGMLRSGKYSDAKIAAAAYLQTHPNDALVGSYLGLADGFLNDDVGAAAAFDKIATIPKQYQPFASQAYSLAAIQLEHSNPSQALSYAQKAMALRADGNAYFALGVAQLANNDAASALTNLKKARDMAGPRATTKEKVAIDGELLKAYTATNDQAGVQATMAEMKQLDPTNNAAARVVAQDDFNKAAALEQAGKFADSVKQWEAGAQADPESAVTGYAQAALAMGKLDKPDFKAMSAEADKALAAKADDPMANYAKGVALVNIGVSGNDDASKKSGVEYLNKADAEAKAANMVGLSLTIETFLKQIK